LIFPPHKSLDKKEKEFYFAVFVFRRNSFILSKNLLQYLKLRKKL